MWVRMQGLSCFVSADPAMPEFPKAEEGKEPAEESEETRQLRGSFHPSLWHKSTGGDAVVDTACGKKLKNVLGPEPTMTDDVKCPVCAKSGT